MVRFRVGGWDVDLFVAKSDYDRECLSRALLVDVDGQPARVVTAEDLLIHKMIKLRTDRRRLLQDLADLKAVIAARGTQLDWTYIDRWLPAGESALIHSVAGATDEELARRFLTP